MHLAILPTQSQSHDAVRLCADVMKMTVWQTPAGIVDEGGFVLESWLNFGVTLLGPPANGIMHVSPQPVLHW